MMVKTFSALKWLMKNHSSFLRSHLMGSHNAYKIPHDALNHLEKHLFPAGIPVSLESGWKYFPCSDSNPAQAFPHTRNCLFSLFILTCKSLRLRSLLTSKPQLGYCGLLYLCPQWNGSAGAQNSGTILSSHSSWLCDQGRALHNIFESFLLVTRAGPGSPTCNFSWGLPHPESSGRGDDDALTADRNHELSPTRAQ